MVIRCASSAEEKALNPDGGKLGSHEAVTLYSFGWGCTLAGLTPPPTVGPVPPSCAFCCRITILENFVNSRIHFLTLTNCKFQDVEF
jgi:hypothetical protein